MTMNLNDKTDEEALTSNKPQVKIDVKGVGNNGEYETQGADQTPAEKVDGEGLILDEFPTEDERHKHEARDTRDVPLRQRLWQVVKAYWMLGLIAFGGPSAHVGILRDHLVVQRQWMDDGAFMELFAIGQGLPGPTSTQLVISTATQHAGPLGGIIAFIFWNLPGLVVLTVCGILIAAFLDPDNPPWYLVGIPPAAITLVFVAFFQFCQPLDKLGVVLALITSLVAIWIDGDVRVPRTAAQYAYPSMLILGGVVTLLDSNRSKPLGVYNPPSTGWNSTDDRTIKRIGIPMWVGVLILLLWASILATSSSLARIGAVNNDYFDIFEVMFRAGSISFGGGQVILPL
jgi:chromate transporter